MTDRPGIHDADIANRKQYLTEPHGTSPSTKDLSDSFPVGRIVSSASIAIGLGEFEV